MEAELKARQLTGAACYFRQCHEPYSLLVFVLQFHCMTPATQDLYESNTFQPNLQLN